MNTQTTKPTVFIAEDDEMFAQMIAVFVERNSEFEAVTFQTGEALMECIDENPDIVILDHNLNDLDPRMMNGIDVLQKLNSDRPTIPVVVFSGQEQIDTAVDLISSGACDYINKHDPSAFELLDSTLQDILNVKAEKSEFAELKDDIQDAKKRLMVVAALVVGMVVMVNLI